MLCGLLSFVLTSGCSEDPPAKPDENRFITVTLVESSSLDEPMAFEVLDDGRVFIIERPGRVKLYNPGTQQVNTIATIPVNTLYTSAEGETREAEEGLVGLTVHPDFGTKPWVYLLYADPDEPKHVLARWDFNNDQLLEETKKVVLEFPVQRETCCHTGGGMTWDEDENLFLTVGNNTGNYLSAQTDERPGRAHWDDQRGASNTNDLRGKILRIHPEDDGTYTIPEGNLFPPGTPKTRPEIYSMGHRNAWRISVDSKTGFVYWGEVGPDASEDTEIGPRGYDELNQGRGPGNYGWPYFIGENHAYPYFDYEADQAMAPKDTTRPMNTSVNNTGLEELPPAIPAFISYPYGVSERFPEVGTGGRSATGGPVYRHGDFDNPARPFPAYYEGKWLAADLARGWIMAISMDENGDYLSMERFVPSYKPAEIIDVKFGPEGDLYVLEYGSRWFQDSDDDKLVRIEYNAGNRTPVVAVSTDKTGGRVPFSSQLSSEGTIDYDGDRLDYTWEIENQDTGTIQRFTEPHPVVGFNEEGVHTATLTVADPSGATNSTSLSIIAGNEPPDIDMEITGNTQFYFPNTPVLYSTSVHDAEDGGAVNPEYVAMSIDYLSDGFDYAEIIQAQRSVDATTRYAVIKALISQSDCSVCHQVNVRSAGPAYVEIAEKYEGQEGVEEVLAQKIRNGGSGVWGEINMPAHPAITMNDARAIADYILNSDKQTLRTIPLEGSYVPPTSEEDRNGSVIIRAAYQDQGNGELPSQSIEKVAILRAPVLWAGDADQVDGARTVLGRRGAGPLQVVPYHNGYIAFHNVDLTGITAAEFQATARTRDGVIGGVIELRLGSVTGELIGSTQVETNESRNRGGSRQATPASAIASTQGRHDLYVVFKNEAARDIDPIVSLTRITFSNE